MEDEITTALQAQANAMGALQDTLDALHAFQDTEFNEADELIEAIAQIAADLGQPLEDVGEVVVEPLPEVEAAGDALVAGGDFIETTANPIKNAIGTVLTKLQRLLRGPRSSGTNPLADPAYDSAAQLELMRQTKSMRTQAETKFGSNWPEDLKSAYGHVEAGERALLDAMPHDILEIFGAVTKAQQDFPSLDEAAQEIGGVVGEVSPILTQVRSFFTKKVMAGMRRATKAWHEYGQCASHAIETGLKKLGIDSAWVDKAVAETKHLKKKLESMVQNELTKLLAMLNGWVSDLENKLATPIAAAYGASAKLQAGMLQLDPAMRLFISTGQKHGLQTTSQPEASA